MIPDIPNYITLPIELGVAILILTMDRRSRRRERSAIGRWQSQQKNQLDFEIRQRERFNNFYQESSKRQMMLLESIMVTLDADKVDKFKSEVGYRYSDEISQDLDDLEELLVRKKRAEISDPELEADIESKIEEIESAQSFLSNIVPVKTLEKIQTIADTAKDAYRTLKDLPSSIREDIGVSPPEDKPPQTVHQEKEDKIMDDFKSKRSEIKLELDEVIRQKVEDITKSIGEQIPDESMPNLANIIKSTLKDMGLGSITKPKKDDDSDPATG